MASEARNNECPQNRSRLKYHKKQLDEFSLLCRGECILAGIVKVVQRELSCGCESAVGYIQRSSQQDTAKRAGIRN